MQECEQNITVGLANVTAVKIKEQAVGRGSEINIFSDEGNLRELVANRPTFKEWLKEIH